MPHWINILRFFIVFCWCQHNFWVSKRDFFITFFAARMHWKNHEKRNKNFCGFFSIWRHPRKGVVQSYLNTYFQKKNFLLANTTWKWQTVKNYWKSRKNIFGDFVQYDVVQKRAWFRAFLSPIFDNLFRTALKQSENQVSLASSFGDI